jgi:hypothetical protein
MTPKPFTPAEIAAAESAVLQDSLKQLARLREILEPLRALEAKATEEPWVADVSPGGVCGQVMRNEAVTCCDNAGLAARRGTQKPQQWFADANMIAAARNAIAEMLRVTGGEP